MTDAAAMPAAEVGSGLAHDCAAAGDFWGRDAGRTTALVRALHRTRRRYGITRLGSVTRLDRGGVCVAQVVRPLALSNAVVQGKGASLVDAAASAFVEALETWAGERIAPERVTTAEARSLGEARALYARSLVHAFDAGWDRLPLRWVDGFDLFSERLMPVPLALVDTVYTHPSPHPVAFPRTTTGLGGGPTLLAAVLHAALERLERATLALAGRQRESEQQVDPASVRSPRASEALARLASADLLAGIWRVPSAHGLPVYRCHVIETERHHEIAPLPGEGFGCDFTHDAALAKALMEAAQARLTAISGAREDITRLSYPERYDRAALDAWRSRLAAPAEAAAMPAEDTEPASGTAALGAILEALRQAGAKAAIVVPLHGETEPAMEIVRLVTPPLPDRVEH